MPSAIGYIRRSTEHQEESLNQQRAKLEEFSKARGWKLAEVYVDDAISGSNLKRPGLEKLIQRAETDKSVEIVLAWERNRLARPKDPIDGMNLERRFFACGKRVFYAATGQEADRSLASSIVGFVEHFTAGDYLRKLSRDTMRGHIQRAQRGLWNGGPIPFGYDRLILASDGKPKRIIRGMPDETQIVFDPETLSVLETIPKGAKFHKQDFETCSLIPSEMERIHAVQRIFTEYAAGVPLRVIRDGINRGGLRTVHGRHFSLANLQPLLENPAYVGRCVYNRRTDSKWHRYMNGTATERLDEGIEDRAKIDWVVRENAWPALIDVALFEQVQERRRESKQAYRRVIGPAVRSEYLLTGLFFCGVCGGLMTGQKKTNTRGYSSRHYNCSVHHRGDVERCPRRYQVPAKVIENYLVTTIQADLTRLANDQELESYVTAEVQRLTGSATDTTRLLTRRVAELDQQLAKLADHFKTMDATVAQAMGLYDQAKALTQERTDVETELKRLRAALPQLPPPEEIKRQALAGLTTLRDVIDNATIEEKRGLLRAYVKEIKADPVAHRVEISLYQALFTQKVAGDGFEPPTFGL